MSGIFYPCVQTIGWKTTPQGHPTFFSGGPYDQKWFIIDNSEQVWLYKY
jgi:hypothetical protein